MDKLDALLAEISQGRIIERLDLAPDQIDDALDRRDGEQFSRKWIDEINKVEGHKAARGLAHDSDPRVRRLRETAYVKSYQQWNSPELAGYISDDFGLIGDAVSLDLTDSWIYSLLNAYMNHSFPCNNPLEQPGDLTLGSQH
jgi:hypothetical protein